MNPFLNKQCRDYSKHESSLNIEQIKERQTHNPKWKRTQENKALTRQFSFIDYHQTINFVNAVAIVAHAQDHHPEMNVSYNRCQVTFSTHSVGGLTDNDFICVAEVDEILVAEK